MRYSQQFSPFSILSLIVGLFFLFYLWLPLFFLILLGGLAYFLIAFLFAKITGKPFTQGNIKIVNIRRYQHPPTQNPTTHVDYIDTTTADKEENKQD